MNGAHDMGGQMGFGPVEEEPDEPVFHADWERTAFGLTIAMGAAGAWNLDMGRQARDQTVQPPGLAEGATADDQERTLPHCGGLAGQLAKSAPTESDSRGHGECVGRVHSASFSSRRTSPSRRSLTGVR